MARLLPVKEELINPILDIYSLEGQDSSPMRRLAEPSQSAFGQENPKAQKKCSRVR
jgi:hypothetical protein